MCEDWSQFRQTELQKPGGIGSRSHDFDADERIILDISSSVAGLSDPRIDIASVSS